MIETIYENDTVVDFEILTDIEKTPVFLIRRIYISSGGPLSVSLPPRGQPIGIQFNAVWQVINLLQDNSTPAARHVLKEDINELPHSFVVEHHDSDKITKLLDDVANNRVQMSFDDLKAYHTL